MTKICFKCKRELSVDEFYPHPAMRDGRLGKCKTCARADVTQNRRNRVGYYHEYDRQRFQRPERRAKQRQYGKARRGRCVEKYKARMAVGNAVRDGRLKRGPCEVCGTTERVQAHHEDCGRPLDVRWLCFRHHREVGHGQTVTAF